jgi:hypothetical protein
MVGLQLAHALSAPQLPPHPDRLVGAALVIQGNRAGNPLKSGTEEDEQRQGGVN